MSTGNEVRNSQNMMKLRTCVLFILVHTPCEDGIAVLLTAIDPLDFKETW